MSKRPAVIILWRSIWMLLGLMILVACHGKGSAPIQTPLNTSAAAQEASVSAISAEGHLAPKAVIDLSFTLAGPVDEVLVQQGEQVAAGQVIARLGNRQQAEAAIQSAQLEVLTAKQALQDLSDNQDSLENEALQALNNARQAVLDAQRSLDALTGYPLQHEIAGAEAQLILAEDQLVSAKEKYESYHDQPETNQDRANARVSFTEAERAYDVAVQRLDDLKGDGYNFVYNQALTTLQVLQEQQRLAEEHLARVFLGPDSDAVTLAQARLLAAQADLASAQASLAQMDLRAPFAGTVVETSLQVGAQVTPGMPVVKIADLSEWIVETSDLTELDIINIRIGQTVQVVADALPQETLFGTVTSIGDTYQEVRGDITYIAKVKFEKNDPRLKWGMTVTVSFNDDGRQP
jgi:multidrug efflux pump subunit AcrA (membrane-fusion protein)